MRRRKIQNAKYKMAAAALLLSAFGLPPSAFGAAGGIDGKEIKDGTLPTVKLELSGNATEYIDGTGAFTVPAGGGSGIPYVAGSYLSPVIDDTDSEANGEALQDAVDAALLLTPGGDALSATNQATVLVLPGNYDMAAVNGLHFNGPYVNIVAVGAIGQTIFTQPNVYITQVNMVGANNNTLKGVSVESLGSDDTIDGLTIDQCYIATVFQPLNNAIVRDSRIAEIQADVTQCNFFNTKVMTINGYDIADSHFCNGSDLNIFASSVTDSSFVDMYMSSGHEVYFTDCVFNNIHAALDGTKATIGENVHFGDITGCTFTGCDFHYFRFDDMDATSSIVNCSITEFASLGTNNGVFHEVKIASNSAAAGLEDGLFYDCIVPTAGGTNGNILRHDGPVEMSVAQAKKYSWTNADIVALGAVFTGPAATITLPAKAVVKNAFVVVTGTGAGTTTLTVSLGYTAAAYTDYIIASDAQAAPDTVYGDASGERGTALTGYDMPSYTATTPVYIFFTSTISTLENVTGSTGDVYVEYLTLP